MGFPERTPRVGFGPEMKNKRPPIIAETDLTAEQVNLNFWQMAGAGRTLPMLVLLFDGATPAIIFEAAAFDPNQELENIAFVRTGDGDYTFTFATTYKNERGVDTSFTPRMSIAMVQGAATGTIATAFLPSGQDVQINVRDIGDVLIDATFMLAVW